MKLLSVKAARDLGPQFVRNKHDMVGQDGAYSIPLSNGTLWFFGDTLIGKRIPGKSLWYLGDVPVGAADMSGKGSIKKMINNTGLILHNSSGRDGLNDFNYILDETGELKNLIPLLPDEDHDEIRIWCLHGVELGEKLYLYFIKVRMLEKSEYILPVEFEIIGSGLAVGDSKTWEFRRIFHNNSDIWWDVRQPHFASTVLPANGWIYCYGVVQDEADIQQCHLARVKPEKIEDYIAYEYFTGPPLVWSSDVDAAIPVFDGMPNELSVTWNAHLGCFLAVHSLALTGDLVGRTSPTPWGPWSDPVTLWTVEAKREIEVPYPVLIYAGKEHPELSEKNGKIIYLTYIEFEEYYPHLVEIELT